MSGNPWKNLIRDAPADWHRVTFAEVFSKRDERGGDDIPLVSVTGDRGVVLRDELERRDTSNPDKSKYLNVHPGDIVYNTMRMWQGVSACSRLRGLTSPAYTVCKPNSRIDPSYAAYLLKLPALIREFHARSQGIVDDTLSLKFPAFSTIPVMLPPLPEQRRIAEILSSVDEAIAATQAVIEQTRTVKQGVLKRLLTKGIGHTRFKQTEIGEIPEAWEVAEWGSLCSTIYRYPGFYGFDKLDEGVGVLRGEHIKGGELSNDWEQFWYVSEDVSARFPKTVVKQGDIVMAVRGSVGNFARVGPAHEGMQISPNLIRVEADPSRLDARFAFHAMEKVVQELRERFVNAQALPALNAKDIKAVRVGVPPLEEQRRIAESLDQMGQAEQQARAELATLTATKSALMSELLTGRKRVPMSELAAAE